jgi:hypothetical protein
MVIHTRRSWLRMCSDRIATVSCRADWHLYDWTANVFWLNRNCVLTDDWIANVFWLNFDCVLSRRFTHTGWTATALFRTVALMKFSAIAGTIRTISTLFGRLKDDGQRFLKYGRISVSKLECLNRFCSLDHAFSNYDERKANEMHFQSKPYI